MWAIRHARGCTHGRIFKLEEESQPSHIATIAVDLRTWQRITVHSHFVCNEFEYFFIYVSAFEQERLELISEFDAQVLLLCQ